MTFFSFLRSLGTRRSRRGGRTDAKAARRRPHLALEPLEKREVPVANTTPFVQSVTPADGSTVVQMPRDASGEPYLYVTGIDGDHVVLREGEPHTTSSGYTYSFGGQVEASGVSIKRDPGDLFRTQCGWIFPGSERSQHTVDRGWRAGRHTDSHANGHQCRQRIGDIRGVDRRHGGLQRHCHSVLTRAGARREPIV